MADIRIVSWNINTLPWQSVLGKLEELNPDVALLQEVKQVKAIPSWVDTGPREHWDSHVWNAPTSTTLFDRWPMVVRMSDRVDVQWFKQVGPTSAVAENEIAVSGIGTIAAARIIPLDGTPPFIVFSMYARWIKPHPSANPKALIGYSDRSTHRIISDLSAFIGHRVLAAGDLNLIYDATEKNPLALPTRDRTIFDRMDAIGLRFVGPRWPDACTQSDPQRPYLLPDTRNVPTFLTAAQKKSLLNESIISGNQLDYVFASQGFGDNVRAYAVNCPEQWGPSDHCRIRIDIDTSDEAAGAG